MGFPSAGNPEPAGSRHDPCECACPALLHLSDARQVVNLGACWTGRVNHYGTFSIEACGRWKAIGEVSRYAIIKYSSPDSLFKRVFAYRQPQNLVYYFAADLYTVLSFDSRPAGVAFELLQNGRFLASSSLPGFLIFPGEVQVVQTPTNRTAWL